MAEPSALATPWLEDFVRVNERGAALLEVLVAVAILATAGASTIGLLGELTRHLHLAIEREREVMEATRVLTATTLLDRDDLDRRLGDRTVAGFTVNVQRPERALYRIAVRIPPAGDSAFAVSPELLVTVVHRPVEEGSP